MRAVDALMECLKAEGVDVVFGLPAAPTSRPTTRSTTPGSGTSWSGTRRVAATPPRATPRRPPRSASRSGPAVPAPRTWSRRSATR